jgi:hypothetical protein
MDKYEKYLTVFMGIVAATAIIFYIVAMIESIRVIFKWLL